MRLLVVDFDFFFPNPFECCAEHIAAATSCSKEVVNPWLYDWGHKEAPFFIGPIWESRASDFLMNDLPLPALSGEQNTFWDRFAFTRSARLFYADSNTMAFSPRVRHGVDSVDLFDAHHDTGYGRRPQDVEEYMSYLRWITCENWMLGYAGRALLSMRYPRWKGCWQESDPKPFVGLDRDLDDGKSITEPFSRIFVCRSGAWVPSWHDGAFEQFVAAAPVKQKIVLDACEPRSFDRNATQVNADRMNRLLANGMKNIALVESMSIKESVS